MKEKQADPIKTFRAQWAVMTFYERFEQVIALALSAIIAVIIVVSLLQLISIVFSLLIIDALEVIDVAEHKCCLYLGAAFEALPFQL